MSWLYQTPRRLTNTHKYTVFDHRDAYYVFNRKVAISYTLSLAKLDTDTGISITVSASLYCGVGTDREFVSGTSTTITK